MKFKERKKRTLCGCKPSQTCNVHREHDEFLLGMIASAVLDEGNPHVKIDNLIDFILLMEERLR